mmetsp:Transcript_24311/g.39422  ORF Transcript_24311/g.39422 Transcript_24311/m.39422 type:complete len:294 (-) Transcript_24311:1262-2143(-)
MRWTTALAGMVSCYSYTANAQVILGAPKQHGVPSAALLWSGNDIALNNYYATQGFTQYQLKDAVQQMSHLNDHTKQGQLDQVLAKGDQAGTIVLYLAPKLDAYHVARGNLGNVKQIVKEAPQSAVLPFVVDTANHGTLHPYFAWQQFNSFISLEDPTVEVLRESLDAQLAKKTKETVMVLVMLSDLESMDKKVSALNEIVQASTKGDFVAILTGKTEYEIPATLVEEPVISARKLEDTTSDVHLIRSTPDVIFGLLVSFVLIMSSLLYFFCLDSLQTPTKFATTYPQMGKVFE